MRCEALDNNSNPSSSANKKDHPKGGLFYWQKRMGIRTSSATPRWGVAATSANTGGYHNFCPKGKNVNRIPHPVSHKRPPKRVALLFYHRQQSRRVAAVDKIEEKRKPDDLIGRRNSVIKPNFYLHMHPALLKRSILRPCWGKYTTCILTVGICGATMNIQLRLI